MTYNNKEKEKEKEKQLTETAEFHSSLLPSCPPYQPLNLRSISAFSSFILRPSHLRPPPVLRRAVLFYQEPLALQFASSSAAIFPPCLDEFLPPKSRATEFGTLAPTQVILISGLCFFFLIILVGEIVLCNYIPYALQS